MATISYEDFEPFCKWQKDQARDVLEIHLQGFKKDQLKVQLSNLGYLTVSGERTLEENNINRFRKEIKLSTQDYKTNEIHARLAAGILYIYMPKKTTPPAASEDQQTTLPAAAAASQDQQPTTLPAAAQQADQEKDRTKSMTSIDSDSKKDKSTAELGSVENTAKLSRFGFELRDVIPNKLSKKMMARNIALGVALIIVVGAFFIYKYGH